MRMMIADRQDRVLPPPPRQQAPRTKAKPEPRSTALVKIRSETAPSKFSYRMERLWLTSWFRNLVQIWMPILALVLGLFGAYLSPAVNGWVSEQAQALRNAVAARPELRIERVSIPVGSPDLQRQILGIMDLALPVSLLDADLARLRGLVEGLSAVKSASLRFEGGVLEVVIVERMPALVWRNLNRIYLLDENGVKVAEVPRRQVRSDLPLLVGEGADRAVLEAREIFSVLEPESERLLGLLRMGERRWDVVFPNKIIMLPAVNAADALRGIMMDQQERRILDLDISVIDLRDPNRRILRLNSEALDQLRRARGLMDGEPV